MDALWEITDEIKRLMTPPGVGFILATVILTEIGTTPRIHESGGRRRYGPLRVDVNRYLK